MLGENKHYSRHRKYSTKSMMNHDFTEKKAIFFSKKIRAEDFTRKKN